MTRLKLRRAVIGIIAILFVVGMVFEIVAQQSPKPGNASEIAIMELLQKQRAILSQLVKLQTAAYQQGEVPLEFVVQARKELLGVDLELTRSAEERIKLHEESVELATELQKTAEAKYRAGAASQADVLKSQAETLRARMDLLRSRQSAN